MAGFKVPKKFAYLLEDSTNKENIAQLKDLISKYIKENLPTGGKLKGRQGVPGLPELIKFNDGKGVKLTGVSKNYNAGKRIGFGYTDLEGSNIREDMLTLMTDKSGAASVTRYGRVARKLPKGFEDHHRRFRALFQPFYQGLSESDSKKLTQWFVEQHAPLGNVLENLEGVDTDLHRNLESSIHSWARANNIQVDMAKPGEKNFYISEDGQKVAVKGGASNIEGVKGPDGKLKFIPDKRPPVVTAKSFGASTRATFPDISKLSLNERLPAASDFLKYVDEPLQDYTAKTLHKQDIIRYGEASPKVRSVDQIKTDWANREANAAARANILADYPNVSAADLDSAEPHLLKEAAKNKVSKALGNLTSKTRTADLLAQTATGVATGNVVQAGVAGGTLAMTQALQSPAAQKAIAKQIAELTAKRGAKTAAKFIPGLDILLSGKESWDYLRQGKLDQAGIAALSGAIGWVPVIGDGAAAALDLTNTGIDISRLDFNQQADTKKKKIDTDIDNKLLKTASRVF